MRDRIMKKIVAGLSIIGGLFILMLIFQFRSINGDDSDISTVDDFVTYQVQNDNFQTAIVSVKADKADDVAGDLNVDISNVKMNPSRFTSEDITSWTNIFKVASYFYDPKLTGYPGSGLAVLALAANETGVDSSGKSPITVLPPSMSKVNLTVTDEMLRKVGITDYVIDGNSEIANLGPGDIGILQMSPGYIRYLDSTKVTGGEYAKLEAANKLQLANSIGLLANVNERVSEATKVNTVDRTDRFNWYDCCNISARLYKEALDLAGKVKGVTISNPYQAMMISAQFHNQPALIRDSAAKGKNSYSSSVRGFSNNSQFWAMYDQLADSTVINKLKANLLEKYKADPKRKNIIKGRWMDALQDWKNAGLVIPAGADMSNSRTSYALRVVHYYIQFEMLYQGA